MGGGTPFLGRGGQKRAEFKGSHVSTCWNPNMSFSLRYGVTFRGLRFGHHVSERNVSTFHVSAAAKYTRETGTIWQIGILQQKGAFFGPKNRHFRPFDATFSVKKFSPVLREFWSIGTFETLRGVFAFFSTKNSVLGTIVLSTRYP